MLRRMILKYALLLLVPGLLAAQEGNVQNGKRLYLKDGCYECHGYAGQGGARCAARSRSVSGKPDQHVRHPAGAMPPYTNKVVSDAELTDIRAFLASLPEPPPLKSIPILNQ